MLPKLWQIFVGARPNAVGPRKTARSRGALNIESLETRRLLTAASALSTVETAVIAKAAEIGIEIPASVTAQRTGNGSAENATPTSSALYAMAESAPTVSSNSYPFVPVPPSPPPPPIPPAPPAPPAPTWRATGYQDGVTSSASYVGTRDTQISGKAPTATAGSSGVLTIDGSPDCAALLKWDISQLPADSTVAAVTIRLYVTAGSAEPYELYEMKRDWSEASANWNTYDGSHSWGSSGARASTDRGSAVIGTLFSPVKSAATITLNAAGIALVQKWIENPSSNFGLIIQDYSGSSDGLSFSSSEASTKANRPLLSITYVTPGLSTIWTSPYLTSNLSSMSTEPNINGTVSQPGPAEQSTTTPSSGVSTPQSPYTTTPTKRVNKALAALYEAIYGVPKDLS